VDTKDELKFIAHFEEAHYTLWGSSLHTSEKLITHFREAQFTLWGNSLHTSGKHTSEKPDDFVK